MQTPLLGKAADAISLGEPVWFRHAKAGEIAEHAQEVIAVRDGDIIDHWSTYRGKGLIFT